MSTLTHTVECGPLGEVDLTISYKFRPAHNGRGIEPNEAAGATIYWVRLGSQEVNLSDDYINDEIIPACVEAYQGEEQEAAESHAEYLRDLHREAA